MDSLQGTLKLKNDPKLFKFSEDNIIYCGEKIMYLKYLIYLGMLIGS